MHGPSSNTSSDGGGLVHAGNDSDGGLNLNVVDTDGNGDGLINVHSDALNGVGGGALDGIHVDAVNGDSLLDAHAPGLVDATVGDGGGLLDGVGSGGDLLGGLNGGDGIQVTALDGDSLATLNGHSLLGDGAGLGQVIGGDGLGLGGLTGSGITVDAVNGDNLAEAHAPGIADATVGGEELGQILSGDGLGIGGLGSGVGGDSIHVDAITGDSLADAHVPGVADAIVGSGDTVGSLLNLDHI